MDISQLKRLYEQRKNEIKQRLIEFVDWGKDEGKIREELFFCLLTPQSKAKTCHVAICNLREKGLLLRGDIEDVRKHLTGVRFVNNKAQYLIEARNKELSLDRSKPFETREWLVRNVKGLGYKEASHFLRNIGFKGLAILDRHILRNLAEYGVIDEIPKTLTRKSYLEIEKKMKNFAKSIEISLDELDLLLWSKETGEIFK